MDRFRHFIPIRWDDNRAPRLPLIKDPRQAGGRWGNAASRLAVGLLAAIGLVAIVRWIGDEIHLRNVLYRDRRHAETEVGFFQDRPYDADLEEGRRD